RSSFCRLHARTMRLHIPAIALALVMLTASKAGQAQESVDGWLKAIDEHAAGKIDEQVYVVGNWSRETLIAILREVKSRNADGSLNAILKRGAQLHGDIGLRIRPRAKGPLEPSLRPGGAMLAQDGREEGAGQLSFHLDVARALLDAVKPRPADHEDIRKWYRTVAAELEQAYNLADALPHLARARAIFADDPDLLLASG